MNIKSKVITFLTAVLVIVVGACSYYYFTKSKSYNELLSSANQAMVSEDYDKAITLYDKALNYKKSGDVSKKIDTAKVLKKSKENYDTAITEMNDKKYLEAIDSFKKVDKQDSKRYETAQGKISECSKLYIADNLKNANDDFKNSKFDDANKCIDNILKLDANNSDAKKLKDDIAKAIQNQKDKAGIVGVSAQVPVAGEPASFDQALYMILKAEFPDNKYAVIENNDGTSSYASLDSTAVIKNEVKCMSDIHGRMISYDSKESKSIEAYFNGNHNPSVTKNGYEFYLVLGGHTRDGYYVEASTGKVYKHNSGNVKCIN